MKKLPCLLLLFIIAFQPGCKKNNDPVQEVSAHVRYGGDPAADGIGYFLRVDSTQENVIPINLPSGYRYPDVDASVSVRLIDVGKRYHYGNAVTIAPDPGLRGVYIVTIRRL